MALASLLCSLSLAVLPVQPDSIISYFNKILTMPQEKVYLQTDKANYSAGENIWFKGYLVSAINHHENQVWSNYLFVDLVNRADSVVMSRKIRRQNNLFYGNLKIDANLPSGYYYLHSYTNWMLNEDQDFHYSKLLQISNVINDDFTATTTYARPDSLTIAATIKFAYQKAVPDHRIKIHYICYDGKNEVRKGTKKTEDDGTFQIEFPSVKTPRIQVIFDDPTFVYQNDFFPIATETDYSVTFFPEGGDLLPIGMQKVAFKAQGRDGYSLPVSGVVKNQRGDSVADIKTVCDGMGLMYIFPNKGDVYHAEVESTAGIKKSFTLPVVHQSGFNLKADYVSKSIHYEVDKTDDINWPDTLYVVAHERGYLRHLQIINAQRTGYNIPDKFFTDGIVHLLLLDKYGKALSERLVFVCHKDHYLLTATPEKEKYGKREKVNVNVEIKDVAGNPKKGDLSVCITDGSLVKSDSLQDNIFTNLLLTSDLKGFVEHPAYYFSPDNRLAKAERDLLMLTHGWRRFKLNDLSGKPDLSFKHYVEYGESFGGTVSNLFGKVKNAQITAVAPNRGIFAFANSDEKGHFIIQGKEYPDTTAFAVTARTAKGGKWVFIEMDKETQWQTMNKIPYPIWNKGALSDEYLQKAREEYFKAGGMKVINLKEVVVKASKIPKPGDPNYFYTSMSDRSISGDALKDYATMNAFEIARILPGVTSTNEDGEEVLCFTRNNKRPILIINDVIYAEASDYSFLQSINGTDVERVDAIIDGAGLGLLGSRGSNGAIIITLKSIDALKGRDTNPNIVKFTPRGYDKSIEFYEPTYDTPAAKEKSEPDFRSTIYWNPKLAADETGKASFSFYTTDSNASENMIIEGITTDGSPVYFEKVLSAKH